METNNLKKFKLIREYPGSYELDTIAEQSGDIKYILPNGKEFFESSSSKNLFKTLIENQPEFWQPVVEKDYEILIFIIKGNILPHTLRRNGKYIYYLEPDSYRKSSVYSKEKIPFDNINIHSVKRLSDGEIFTIGDKTDKGIITKILLHPVLKVFGIRTDLHDCWNGSETFNKLKSKLFTSEDGVDIFEGDNLYSIDNMLNIKKHRLFNARYDGNTLLNNRIFFNSDYKHFSTKEKAEEYIIENKPCLTYKDIEEIITTSSKMRIDLLRRVKDKIKKIK